MESSPITHVAVGGILGALVGWFVVPRFLDGQGFDPEWPRAVYGVGLAFVGAGIGHWNGSKYLRRRKEMRRLAQSLGMQYSAFAEPDLEDRLIELLRALGPVTVVRLSHALKKTEQSTRIVAGDLEIRYFLDQDYREFRTVVLLELDELNLPEFLLQPRDIWKDAASVVTGHQGVDLNGHPEISEKYQLTGDDPDRLQQLFREGVVDFFADRPGLQVIGRDKQLVILWPRRRTPPEQFSDLVQQALNLLKLVTEHRHSIA